MGAEQSFQRGRPGLHRAMSEAILANALLEALQEASAESSSRNSPEMYEHAWDPRDCAPPFCILPDRLTARRRPSILTTDSIRGKKGYTNGRHVWEILWENEERGSFAIVGVATRKAHLQALGYQALVGSNSESWGWDIVNKTLWHDGQRGSYPAGTCGFQVPDTFFVILDMDERTLSFSTSDVHLGVAFNCLPKEMARPLYPVANAIFGNCDIRMRYMGRGESIISNLRRPISFHRTISETTMKSREKTTDERRKSTGQPEKELDSSMADPSSIYQFARHKHGENIAVMFAGKRAMRVESECDGVVITSNPLTVNKLFEVRLDSKIGRWVRGLGIGATTNNSDSFSTFPSIMAECTQGSTFTWTGNEIIFNVKLKKAVRENTNELSTGDRIGVMRKPDNSLHFYLNGKDIGNCFRTIPDTLYGFVDVYGHAEQVTITGGSAETQSSNDKNNSIEQAQIIAMIQMKKVIELMKEPGRQPLVEILKMLAECIEKPYRDTNDRSVRQRYGDHLADIGAVRQLKELLERLDNIGAERKDGWLGMQLVRSILWNYSDASLKIAKEIGKNGLLGRFANEMKSFGKKTPRNEKRKYILESAVNIMHNCAKATENRQVFRDINAVEVLAPFLACEDTEVVISALLTMSYITEENQTDLLEADTKTISTLRDMLANAASSAGLRGSSGSCTWSALEIVTGIGNIAVNMKNCTKLIDADVVSLLFDVIKKGGQIEKESSANALWALANVGPGKKKIREYPDAIEKLKELSKNSNKSVAAAAERVLLKIRQMQQGSSRKNCEYKEACRSFMATLNLSSEFFDTKYNKCYCTECHASRNDKLYYTQGNPAKDYAVPIGWCRFSLRMDRAAVVLAANTKWHVAYHGTSSDKVKSILECGQLLLPGDTALGGKKLSEVDGHFTDDNKPEGFNTKQIFVSPSIRYSGLEVYAKTKRYVDPQTKKSYEAKVALQLWIKPDSYNVGPQTVGAEDEIDPKFSNQEIEWSTLQRGAIHLSGVLIHLE